MKGNAQSMDLLDRLEIYVPVEAEVKSISLFTLPNSVLRRMGLTLPDSKGSRKRADSPQGIWICPVVLRRKGQKPAYHTGNSVTENMSTLGRAVQAMPGPFRMSFVSSNHAAYRVLKDCMPGKKVSAHTPLLPPGSALKTYEHAVIIYHGSIYLSIRKPKRSQIQREACEPQPASPSSIPSTSAVSSKSQRKELQNHNRPKKNHTTCKVTHSETRKDVKHKGRDVSSCKTARSVLQATAEEAAGPEPACFQPQGKQEAANCDSEEAESTNQNNDVDSSLQMDRDELDNGVGIVEQSSDQSWTGGQYQGDACVSTSLYQGFDYEELEQEENINQLKAKLKAAHDNLQFLKKSQNE